MKIAVVGASGLVGAAVSKSLAEAGNTVLPLSRRPTGLPGEMIISGLEDVSEWGGRLLRGADVVVNAAARVHMMRDAASNPLLEFRRINAEGALALARRAHEAGASRYIYLSSVKVNGEHTDARPPFTADEPPAPTDPYSQSKLEAEQQLFALSNEIGLEIVVLRPPLVYGPGVRANFATMMRWVQAGVPLPLASVDNLRSLVGVDNLGDLIGRVAQHPQAAGQVFLVSDNQDVSTPELLLAIGRVLGKPARLFSMAPPVLNAVAGLVGKGGAVRRLIGNLQVNIEKTMRLLEWNPPMSLNEGLEATARAFLQK